MTMGNPNVKHWIIKAAPVLQRVSKAKTRFSAAIGVNQVTILAAADELEAATMEAMVWMMENHCSDVRLDSHVSLMLNSCAEVAQTAKRAHHSSLRRSRGGLGPTRWPAGDGRLRLTVAGCLVTLALPSDQCGLPITPGSVGITIAGWLIARSADRPRTTGICPPSGSECLWSLG